MTKNEFGKLYIKIVSAKNTLALDLTGTSDPYCLISLIYNVQTGFTNNSPIYKTEIIPKTLNPIWKDEEFIFDINQPSQEIYLEMWDEDKVSKDDFMGMIKLSVEDLIRGSKLEGSTTILDLPLKSRKSKSKEKNRGTIQIHYQYWSQSDLISPLIRESLLIKSITKILHQDEFAKSLMFILANNGHLLETLGDILTVEIENTDNINVLFRTDSLATKITVSTFKIIGYNYLEAVILPLIKNICNDNLQLEVDPLKGPITEKQSSDNLKIILNYCDGILNSIQNSIHLIPEEMKQLLCLILNQVQKKFPSETKESSLKSVGGFFFLRFLVPTLFSRGSLLPSDDGSNISHESRRTLTLISKILQNISNQLIITKETFLLECNPYISTKIPLVIDILQKVSSPKSLESDHCQSFKSMFTCDDSTLFKYSDQVYMGILEKKQLISTKISSLNENSLSLLDQLEKRCSLFDIQSKQDSKKYILK
ncbi:C2 domain-containing protein [Tieghemostelium lacteum]|uniref:C2 domain-containing protein n=1 Tax=Tieghemostelium lacteum TaxID=361077 RepID=A0A151Z8I0_TIELA|nr:C2 domain-containing protein [Tieghemostelium lacteum]|eukprot:KYQ90245.1 C2 domain-containing protein [Tieghemostelium lacteum]